jgi:hypothetical protein
MSPEEPQDRPAQFSLRSLVLLTALLAPLFALAGVLVTTWQAESKLLFLVVLVATLFFPGVTFAVFSILQRNCAQRGGRLLLRITDALSRTVFVFGAGYSLFWIVGCPFLAIVGFRGNSQPGLGEFWLTGLIVMLASCSTTVPTYVALSARTGLELRQHGIVWQVQFIPWSSISWFRWTGKKGCQLTLELGMIRLESSVASELKDAVEGILLEHGVRPFG